MAAELELGAKGLSAERCDELRSRGRALGLDGAVEAALAFCVSPDVERPPTGG